MAIQSTIKTITPTFKNSLHNPNFFSPKPLITSFPHKFTQSKPISFQKIPTKPPLIASSSSQSSELQPLDELPAKLQEIIKLFQSVNDPRAKYEQLLFYAKKLPPLEEKYKTKENKVEGCVSQVWVRAFRVGDVDDSDSDSDSVRVCYESDSDSIMTKGLAALLVLGLSGEFVRDVIRVSPDFVTLLGLQQNLTPSRNNGFVNMLDLMKRKALVLGFQAEKRENEVNRLSSPVGENRVNSVDDLNGNSSIDENRVNSVDDSSGTSSVDENRVNSVNDSSGNSSVDENRVNSVNDSSGNSGEIENVRKGVNLGRRGERIREILEKELNPIELEIEDVSYQHAGHAGVRGSEGETHFNLKVVSAEFEGKSMVKRHRIIYGLLENELQSGLHALSITAQTPAQV